MRGQAEYRSGTFDVEFAPYERRTDDHHDDRQHHACGTTAEQPRKAHRQADTHEGEADGAATFGAGGTIGVGAGGHEHPQQAVGRDPEAAEGGEHRERDPHLGGVDAEMIGDTTGHTTHDATAHPPFEAGNGHG